MINPKSQKLADRLQDAGEKTLAFFSALTPDQWNQQIYTDSANWRVRQILAHFVATEDAFTQLIINALESGARGPADFDLDAYNESHVDELRDLSPEELLERFAELRAQTEARVRGLEDTDLEKEGWHPFFGLAPVDAMLKLIFRHNQIHQRDIRKVLEPRAD